MVVGGNWEFIIFYYGLGLIGSFGINVLFGSVVERGEAVGEVWEG